MTSPKLSIALIDDEPQTLRLLTDLLTELKPEIARQAGIRPSEIEIDPIDNALAIVRSLNEAKSTGSFKYDFLIADIFMPMDPSARTEHPQGGAVQIYEAIKDANLSDKVFLLIISKDIAGAERDLVRIVSEQQKLDFPWTSRISKPSFSNLVDDPSSISRQAWSSYVIEVIAHRKDQAWQKENFLRIQPDKNDGQLIFERARIDIDRIVADSKAPYLLIVGEAGTGKEYLANYFARRLQRHETIDTLKLTVGNESNDLLRLFGRELPSPRPGTLEKNSQGIVFLENFAIRSAARKPMDARLLNILRSMNEEPAIGTLQSGSFCRIDGESDIKFSGVLVFSAGSMAELQRNSDLSEELIELLGKRSVYASALRENPTLIPSFARHYLQIMQKNAQLDDTAIRALQNYSWPNNLKELETILSKVNPTGAWISDADLMRVGIQVSALKPTFLIKLKRLSTNAFWQLYRKALRLWGGTFKQRGVIALIAATLLAVITILSSTFVQELVKSEMEQAAKFVRSKTIDVWKANSSKGGAQQ